MKVAVPSASSRRCSAARLLADGVERLVAQDVLRVRVRRACADPDLQPLRPPPARPAFSGSDRRSEDAAVGLRAAGVRHLGRRAVPAHGFETTFSSPSELKSDRSVSRAMRKSREGRTIRQWSLSPTVEARLRANGTHNARRGKAYLKSDLAFAASRRPDARRGARARRCRTGSRGLVALFDELWSKPKFERRMAATVLLAAHTVGCPRGPAAHRAPRCASRRRGRSSMPPSDVIGEHGRGARPGRDDADARPRATDDDFWVRRAALLAELRPIRKGPHWIGSGPRGADARGARVLHPQGDRLGAARGGKRRPDDVAAGWRRARDARAESRCARQ